MDKSAAPLLQHDVITKIAEETKKTPAQVLLRWATQRNIAVIPKSNNVDRLSQNLNSTDFELTDAQLKAVSALNQGLRFNNPAEVDVRMSIFA